MKNFLISAVFIALCNIVFSQTGPGGVGTNDGTSSLKMWYRPDFGVTAGSNVSAWLNGAGDSNHDLMASGGQRPTFNNGTVNGYDELSFDGNDYMQITGSLSNSNFITNQASSFVVNSVTTTSNSWVYATSPHQSNRFSCHISWGNGRVYFDTGNCCGTSSRLQINGLSGLNTYSYWSYDAINSTGKQLYRNGTLLQSRANTTTYNSHATQSFRIGESYQGKMTEIIIFNKKINLAQRLIIENYLSAKYNITAASNDLYDEDDVANGDFDHDVAGIGRVDATNLHDDSRGTGIVRMLNPSNLNDDEFYFWGHDNGVEQSIEISDIPASINSRFDRVWRGSEVNVSGGVVNIGTVDMRWDLSSFGALNAADLRLLVDTDNDGIFSDETPISGAVALGGGIYEFTGVSALMNNLRFTIGTVSVPLPITLVNFNVNHIEGRTTKISWQTLSEINNDYFTIEKSTDGVNWTIFENLDGAGNSSVKIDYLTFDYNTQFGTTYYRLKQTDYNGEFTYSKIKTVTVGQNNDLDIYPNPTEGEVRIKGDPIELSDISIFNILGENVTNNVLITGGDKNSLLNFSELPKGIYFVKTRTQISKIVKE